MRKLTNAMLTFKNGVRGRGEGEGVKNLEKWLTCERSLSDLRRDGNYISRIF